MSMFNRNRCYPQKRWNPLTPPKSNFSARGQCKNNLGRFNSARVDDVMAASGISYSCKEEKTTLTIILKVCWHLHLHISNECTSQIVPNKCMSPKRHFYAMRSRFRVTVLQLLFIKYHLHRRISQSQVENASIMSLSQRKILI